MGKRFLGKSDLKVSPIGLGCWQFSKGRGIGGKFWGVMEQKDINEVVAESYKGGVNWFDTAEIYGNGESERALARSLQNLEIKPGEVLVASKWMPALRFASSIVNTIDMRLRALNPYPINLYQIHSPLSFSSIEDQMRAMAQLVRKKKIGYIGVSNFSAELMRQSYDALAAEGFPLVSNQMRFSLLDRSIEKNGVLDVAEALGITIIAYSPLAQGLLTGKFHDNPSLIKRSSGLRKFAKGFRKKDLSRTQNLINVLKKIAAEHDATPAQIALSWTVNFHGKSIIAIPGATHARQAKQNAAAMQIKLTKKELNSLDESSRAAISI